MQQYTRFADILLPSASPFSSYSIKNGRGLGTLSLINTFIGANNSGKSRLLRALFSLKEFEYTTNNYTAELFYSIIKEIQPMFDETLDQITSIGPIRSDFLQAILKLDPYFISPSKPIYSLIEPLLLRLSTVKGGQVTSEFRTSVRPLKITDRLNHIANQALEKFQAIKIDTDVGAKKRYYIPILRGMRPLDGEHTNLYKTRTIDDYFRDTSLQEGSEIFTGLELYHSLKKKLLGEPEDRENVKKFEDFLSKKFFRSRQVTLIPREGDNTVHIKIGNERQLQISQLGDGLQSLIICTFNIFLETERCMFFIEEPDMCMHPSLQRSFLEVLSDFNQHQYFITSHSNHLLDMTIDFTNVSVFHFSKMENAEPSFEIRLASSRDHRILLDLGVRNSSVFLTNATIWVEGITDRLYIRTYMEKYLNELKESDPNLASILSNLKEDYHYSFVEYQGANLTHWGFDPSDEDVKRIKATYVCGHAFLIADGDVSTKGNREEFYRQILDDRFLILEVKEIENLMPPEVLKEVTSKKFHAQSKDTSLIRYEDYSKPKTPIGKYLDKLLELPKNESVFAGESGTIKGKITFCENAVEIMNREEFDWILTQELQDLCHKLFEHIITQNNNQSIVL